MTQELEVQDNSAKYYEEQRYVGTGLRYHKYVIDRMTKNGTLLKGRILDVGCGTGILPRLYPTKDIIGVDASREMLKYNPGFAVHGNAESLDFNSGMFDTIFCRSVLHHLKSPTSALAEFDRVLNPGGNLLLWETNKSWIAQLVRRYTQHGDRFSEYHSSFSNLDSNVKAFFNIDRVTYCGFIGYCLFGFPDIISFGLPEYIFSPITMVDEILEKIPLINRLSFAVMIHARKQ